MQDFQRLVWSWFIKCFPEKEKQLHKERAFRFFEEAVELVQTQRMMTAEECHKLVDYVFSRPMGSIDNEIGGVMVTLACLCEVTHEDLEHCAWKELDRIERPEIIAKIRNKQVTKILGLE